MNETITTINDARTYNTMCYFYKEDDVSKIGLSYIIPGSYVLSAGCGAGREMDFLINKLKCMAIGIDLDRKALSLSKAKIPNAEHILGDMVKMRFEKKFDYIVCLWNSINYLKRKERKRFVETCYSNLKHGGDLIIVTTHTFSHWRHLLCNIKYKRYYHPSPWEIKGWFKDTQFEVFIKRKGKNVIVLAKKLNLETLKTGSGVKAEE